MIDTSTDKGKLQQVARLLKDAQQLLLQLEYPSPDDVKNYECLACDATTAIDEALEFVTHAGAHAQ